MKTYYQGRATQLQAEIDQILSHIDHDVSRGHHAEEVLREFLRQELSSRYGVDSGFVFTPDKKPSRQIDIIIHDPFYSPPLQSMKGFKAFPAESVFSCVAVKIPLSTASLITGTSNAIENIESVKTKPKIHVLPKKVGSMTTSSKPSPTIGCVFGFRTETSFKTLKENLANLLIEKSITIDQYSEKYPDIICGLDTGVIIANPKKYGLKGGHDFVSIENTDSLMNFMLALQTMMNQMELMPVNLFPYMSD